MIWQPVDLFLSSQPSSHPCNSNLALPISQVIQHVALGWSESDTVCCSPVLLHTDAVTAVHCHAHKMALKEWKLSVYQWSECKASFWIIWIAGICSFFFFSWLILNHFNAVLCIAHQKQMNTKMPVECHWTQTWTRPVAALWHVAVECGASLPSAPPFSLHLNWS